MAKIYWYLIDSQFRVKPIMIILKPVVDNLEDATSIS